MDIQDYTGACLTCVDENDENILKELLDTFQFEESDPDLVEKFFIGLLDYTYTVSYRENLSRLVLSKWENYSNLDINLVDENNVVFKEKVKPDFNTFVACRIYNFPRLLKYVLSLSDNNFKDMIYPYIIRNVNDITTQLICASLDSCFESKYEDYKFLYDASIDININVARYMKARLVSMNEYANIPFYVKIQKDKMDFDSLVQKWTPRKIPILKEKDLIEYLYQKAKDNFSFSTNEENSFKQDLTNNIDIQQLSKIKFWEEYNNNNADLFFRLFGFSNASEDILDGESTCTKFGGCRMFLCQCYSREEGIDYEIDWFTGYCNECGIRIRNRTHALRLPKLGGGWQFCFCTFHCIKNHIENLPGQCNSPDNIKLYSAVRKMQMYLRENNIFDFETDSTDCGAEEQDIGEYTCRVLKEIDMSEGIDYEKSNLELEIEKEALLASETQK